VLFLRSVQNALDLRPVAEPGGRAGRICDPLRDHVARNLPLVLEEQPFELDNVVEFLSARQAAARIHGLRTAEREFEPVLSDPFHGLPFFRGTVTVAPRAQNVEAFQREAGWIDLDVTDRA